MDERIEKNWHFEAAGETWVVPEYHITKLPDGTEAVSFVEIERIHRLVLRKLDAWDAIYTRRKRQRVRPSEEIEFRWYMTDAGITAASANESPRFRRVTPMHMSETSVLLLFYANPDHVFTEADLIEYILAQKMVDRDWEWLENQEEMTPELFSKIRQAYVENISRWYDAHCSI